MRIINSQKPYIGKDFTDHNHKYMYLQMVKLIHCSKVSSWIIRLTWIMFSVTPYMHLINYQVLMMIA